MKQTGVALQCVADLVRRSLSVVVVALALSASAAQAQPVVYVANTQSSNVSVIDSATNSVVMTIAVQMTPFGVGVTPDGAWVYVSIGVALRQPSG